MKELNNYILEKLKINKDSKLEILDENSKEYKNVNFIFQGKDTLSDFKKYGSVSINYAYNSVKFIIDNLQNDLKNYYFELFYSGNSGFTVYNDKHLEIGYILFKPNENKVSYIIYKELKNNSKYFKTSIKLANFIKNNQDKINSL